LLPFLLLISSPHVLISLLLLTSPDVPDVSFAPVDHAFDNVLADLKLHESLSYLLLLCTLLLLMLMLPMASYQSQQLLVVSAIAGVLLLQAPFILSVF
jgi:hypothetical protein